MADTITLILAYGPNGELGLNGGLPWPSHKEDLRRFREATLGTTCIMGRHTYESLGGPLKYRRNIVVSRSGQPVGNGIEVAKNVPEAVKMARGTTINIIGGAKIYVTSMQVVNRILLTLMHGEHPADTFFKVPFLHEWTKVSHEEWRGEGGDCDFLEYVFDKKL